MKPLPVFTVTSVIITCLIVFSSDLPTASGASLFQLETAEVTIKPGKLVGIVRHSRNGRRFTAFRGIPYAEPPVGKLRFEPSVPKQPWKRWWDATSYGAFCLQYEYLAELPVGNESCLFLNVQTPNTLQNATNLFPVIVYFHGGVFMGGYSNVFNAKYFMDEDVVIVTLNYRLGIFGFLNTGDETVRGNMGMKDQNLALRWVQENIAFFGGDPNKVTLMGSSAGGSAAQYHALSPMSKGLFHRIISMSGTALNNFAFKKDPISQSQRLGGYLNCPTFDNEELVDCLRNLPAEDLNTVNAKYLHLLEGMEDVYTPTVEAVNDENTFLSDTPKNIIRDGKATKVPWMVGTNSLESQVFVVLLLQQYNIKALNTLWDVYCPLMFDYTDHPARDNISVLVKNHYFGEENLDYSTFRLAAQALSDRFFYEGMSDAIRLLASTETIYAYHFSYRTEYSFANMVYQMPSSLPKWLGLGYSAARFFARRALGLSEPDFRGGHFDDLPLFFYLPNVASDIRPGHKDYEMSKALVKAWVSFARDGNPGSIFGTEWEPIPKDANENADLIKLLNIDSNTAMIPEPYAMGVKFWKSLNVD